MTRLPIFLYGLAVLLLGTFGPGTTARAQEVTYVRESVHTVGHEVLAAYARAIRVMEERGADNPLSWYYQANIHHVPECDWNDVALPGCVENLKDPSTWPGETEKTWAACPHGNHMFLAWHRLYIYYLEHLVRQAADAPGFALPYWDYSQPKEDPRRLPEPLRDPQSAVNRLFVSERNEVDCGEPAEEVGELDSELLVPVNAGGPLNYTQITSDEHALRQRQWPYFSSAVEQQPHNMVHTYLGAYFDCSACGNGCSCEAPPCKWGWMSELKTAARDPVFWLHHANIDRIWVQWAAIPGNRNPSTPEEIDGVLEASRKYIEGRCKLNGIHDWEECKDAEIFIFFEARPDGTPREVRWSARGMLEGTISTEQLGYRYDDVQAAPATDFSSVAAKAVTLAGPGAAPSAEERAVRRLGNSARVFDLPIVGEAASRLEKAVRTLTDREAAPAVVRLRIKGIRLTEGSSAPIGHYEIYANLPEIEGIDLEAVNLRTTWEAHFVGSLGFFALSGGGHHHGGLDFQADITENVVRLQLRRAWQREELSVIFVPRGPHPEEAAIEFEAIELLYE